MSELKEAAEGSAVDSAEGSAVGGSAVGGAQGPDEASASIKERHDAEWDPETTPAWLASSDAYLGLFKEKPAEVRRAALADAATSAGPPHGFC